VGSIDAPRFSLRHSLECGQFFGWTKTADAYYIRSGEHFFRAGQDGDRLHVDGVPEAVAREFFALDHDAAAIEGALRRDRRLREAVDVYSGLRLLRQDPWDCTASFIISIASNIPRITRNVGDIARRYGRPLALGGFASHAFPRPGQIADPAGLRRLKLGFRAKYLTEAERLARSGLLDDVAGMPYEEAKEMLLVIPGVAEKVADCVLLFAYGHGSAFPVDTWIRRVMIEMFFQGRRVPDRAIRAFAQERWGELAGYAQQFLYVWSRESRPVIYREPVAV
jgi:N-glycosylase/DNA lyase